MVLHARLARSAALVIMACGFGAAENVDTATSSAAGSARDVPNVTGKLGDAASITNNPPGRYRAAWTATATNPFSGSVEAISSPNGKGVIFLVNLENLPAQGGPFSYHIHDQPVPEDGNCTKTLAHLDPYQRGQKPDCDASEPQTCEVGDLSGKHGKIEGTNVQDRMFHDMYTSLAEGIGAYVGNRSLVIHFANTTRFACSNFVAVYPDRKKSAEKSRPLAKDMTLHARRMLSFMKGLRGV
ncbi:hypothetical protein MCOR25_001290 [Pyricularia grisea]|uniref:superoxide dismutase n=1 Tax=Pyricularia grisea TaxID=148305 RepID=A0A6P8BGB6_PYRGI|nr:uncharacterized protein PgNI_00702 [Pyricularia grisea]KAI6381359.1 hypothetical protein MCOR25_001290 [Pyricularia grisea]TLD15659.1 hypothetical protein PgNI_00702 [Pyricularia grisea]